MGRTGSNKVQVEPAPEDAVLIYKRTGKDKDGPSVDRFQVDFSGGRPEKSPWNLRLAEIFANDYTKRGLPLRELKEVTQFFLTYIHSLQTVHRRAARTAASGSGSRRVSEGTSGGRIRERKKSVRSLSPLLYNYTDTFD